MALQSRSLAFRPDWSKRFANGRETLVRIQYRPSKVCVAGLFSLRGGPGSGVAGDAVVVAVELGVGGVVRGAAEDRRDPGSMCLGAVGVHVPGCGAAAGAAAVARSGSRGRLRVA